MHIIYRRKATSKNGENMDYSLVHLQSPLQSDFVQNHIDNPTMEHCPGVEAASGKINRLNMWR